MQLIRNFIEADIAGGAKMSVAQLVERDGRSRHPGHPHASQLWPMLRQVLGSPS